MKTVLAVACAVLAGCGTEGAVLELDVGLPPAGTACGTDRAAVRTVFERDLAGAGSCPFSADWAAGDCIADLPLDSTETRERLSVVAPADDVSQPLCVKIVFGENGCLIGATPTATATLRIDPAFSDARYTELAVTVADACTDQSLGTRAASPIP